MMARLIKSTLITSLIALFVTHVACQQRESRRLSTVADPYRNFKSPCGTADQISRQIGACMKEILDFIEGRVPEGKTDQDFQNFCNKFNNAEKCIRNISKDCLSGIHKTAVGSIASGSKRWRTRECRSPEVRARYRAPLKCSIRLGDHMERLFQNHTAIVQGIRDLPIVPEEKLIKMCCVLIGLEKEIERNFNRECPESTSIILATVHGLTDDARNVLCLNPRCSGSLDRVINTKYKPPQNLFEPVTQLMFQLSTN